MSEKLETLIEQLGKLTVVEALELSKKLEEAWGVTATAGAPAPAAGGAPVEEKAEVDVILTGYNDNAKIPVLKKVREFTQLGLLEAKTFVEGLPKPIKQGIDKEEADKIKKALEEVGGKVELK
jgi:large subunit ribosomal protein L7/L12|tara:strand:- start:639 stop:1007 length:369 start_codon:yes stop_codon:yes gene_type:complete